VQIALVTHNIVRGNGQGRVNYELVKYCLAQGIQVTLLAQQVAPDLLDGGAVWHPMRSPKARLSLIDVNRFARKADAVISSSRSEFDVVIANGFTLTAAHDVNVSHFVHGAWIGSPFHISRFHRGPYGWYQWLFTRTSAASERKSYSAAGHVVAVSTKVRDELIQIGVPARTIQTIVNGVSLEEFYPGVERREQLGLPLNVPLALFVGDIRTCRKNLDTVLRAMLQLPSTHLAVVGDLKKSPYPAIASGLGLADRAHFLGFRRDVPKIMRACDVFVFPSRYEACSLAILEALASGLPVVTSRSAGGSEIVTPACGHVLTDAEDAAALADAVARFANGNNSTARLAARTVAQEHSWSKMASEYVGLFESIVNSPQRSMSGGLSSTSVGCAAH
jgi:glycosyltransferase involved in cell wall biosynthesis